jgi:hypothetical protein
MLSVIETYRDYEMDISSTLCQWCRGLSDQRTDNQNCGCLYCLYVAAARTERALRVGVYMVITALGVLSITVRSHC